MPCRNLSVSLATLFKKKGNLMEADTHRVKTGKMIVCDSSADSEFNLRRADGDIKGAVRLFPLSDSITSQDNAILTQLLYKHPSAPERTTLSAALEAEYPMYVTQEENTRKTIASFWSVCTGNICRPSSLARR